MNPAKKNEPLPDYATVTEVAGEQISREQLQRMCHRYRWAGDFCRGKDVVEIACGSGQGLGYLASLSKSIVAGDIMPSLVNSARAHYRDRVDIRIMDATAIPTGDASQDVIILFEAIYYLPDADAFAREAARVLRPGGTLLIVTANKDMWDFNPSPFSQTYYGSVELAHLMRDNGFTPELSGAWALRAASPLQRLLAPIKKLAVATGLMPKTMNAKKFLKRIVFGPLAPMPVEIDPLSEPYEAPIAIDPAVPDRTHRVLYCAARRL